jgi:hypothetical protein
VIKNNVNGLWPRTEHERKKFTNWLMPRKGSVGEIHQASFRHFYGGDGTTEPIEDEDISMEDIDLLFI